MKERIMTINEFAGEVRSLMSTELEYVWGSDGFVISELTMERLYDMCGDPDRHTKDYYNSILLHGKGHLGADEAGFLNIITGFGYTTHQYFESSTPYMVALPEEFVKSEKDSIYLMFGNKGRLGVYLGKDNITVEMTEGEGLRIKKYVQNGWNYCALPFFCSDVEISTKTSETIRTYQEWLRGMFGEKVPITGEYDMTTKASSVRALKKIHNEFCHGHVEITDLFTADVRDEMLEDLKSVQLNGIMNRAKYNYDYAVTAIGNVRIAVTCPSIKVVDIFDDHTYVTQYQQQTRGLVVTTRFDINTLHRLFWESN